MLSNCSVGKSNTSDTTHHEQEQEGKSEEHRSVEVDVTTVDGSKSREDFDTGRHSNNHSSSGEVSTTVDVHTNNVHVMSSDDETEKTNGHHSVNHTNSTEDRFTGETRKNVTNNTESWENHNISVGGLYLEPHLFKNFSQRARVGSPRE